VIRSDPSASAARARRVSESSVGDHGDVVVDVLDREVRERAIGVRHLRGGRVAAGDVNVVGAGV